jgi:hypothetical protein
MSTLDILQLMYSILLTVWPECWSLYCWQTTKIFYREGQRANAQPNITYRGRARKPRI